ncbi:MAG: hypothetical protein J1F03_00665 [Oscillospiraceae bacterium]|nr:hypothetical protein [Oscillospiraceae bacterium]
MGLFNLINKKNSFPFHDKPNTAVFTCIHVLNEERPILHVTHDEDGYWQFLCGDNHNEDEAKIIALSEAYELDNSVGNLAEMDYGHSADRKDEKSDWVIK